MFSAIDEYEQGKDDAFNGRPNLRLSVLYDLGFADGLSLLYCSIEEEEVICRPDESSGLSTHC